MAPFNPSAMFAVVLVLAALFMCERAYSATDNWGYPNPGPVVAPKTFVTRLVDRATLTTILRANDKDPAADALAFWRLKPCEIYITAPPERNGPWLLTWGRLMRHEIKHCIYGAYHD